MSHEVLTLAALSSHPALVESHRNRTVLLRLANRASADGGGIRPSIPRLADLIAGGRPDSGDAYRDEKTRETRQRKLRDALAELERAGLLCKTGEVYGDPGKEVPVRRIMVEALAAYVDPAEAGEWLVKAFPTAAFGGQGCPSPAGQGCPSGAGVPVAGRAAIVGQGRGARGGQGRGAPHGQPNQYMNQSSNQSIDQRAGADAPAGTLGDEVEVLNAATALRNAAALAPRRGAPTRRPAAPVEPSIPEPEPVAEPEPTPEPRKPSPGEVRVTAAVESLLSEIGADGQPERTLKLWRAKLRSRLTDDGVSGEAVAKRAETIRAAWGNLQRSTWHIEHGCATRGHLFAKTLHSGTNLDAMAVKRAGGPRTPAKPWAAVGAPAPMPLHGLTDADRAAIEAETEAIRNQRPLMPERKAPAPVVTPVPEVSPAGQARLTAVFDLFSMGDLKAGPSGTRRG